MSQAAPLISRPIPIGKDWSDHNGHLNMAFYSVVFDRGADCETPSLHTDVSGPRVAGFPIDIAERIAAMRPAYAALPLRAGRGIAIKRKGHQAERLIAGRPGRGGARHEPGSCAELECDISLSAQQHKSTCLSISVTRQAFP